MNSKSIYCNSSLLSDSFRTNNLCKGLIAIEPTLLYIFFYIFSIMLLALSQILFLSLVRKNRKNIILVPLLIFMLGLPPMPTFFTKVAIMLSLVSQGFIFQAILILFSYLTLWHLSFFVIKFIILEVDLYRNVNSDFHIGERYIYIVLTLALLLISSIFFIDLYFIILV